MKTASAKAKGRALQNWVRDLLMSILPIEYKDDVRCALMGETGADVKIHERLQPLFPYNIECKNQEVFTNVYKAYEQAEGHGEGDPLVIIKMNRRKPLAVVDAEYFIRKHIHDEYRNREAAGSGRKQKD